MPKSTELQLWRRRARNETNLKHTVIDAMSVPELREAITGNDKSRFEAPPAEEVVFERFVTADEAAGLIFSGEYDDLTCKEFRTKFPFFGTEDGV